MLLPYPCHWCRVILTANVMMYVLMTAIDYTGACSLLLPKGRHTLIDADDLPRLSPFQWYVITNRKTLRSSVIECKSSAPPRIVYLHRFLLDAPSDMLVDHIDRDSLNNRQSNLRLCTKPQNAVNSRIRSGKRHSIYKGVTRSWHKRLGDRPWMAYVCKDGKRIYLGKFATEIEAARAYNVAALALYGSFALMNPV